MSGSPMLVVVDMQRDFMAGGALPTSDPGSLIEPLNRALEAAAAEGMTVVATRDWHPPDHASFRENGGPWPDHCVAGTPGAEFDPGLRFPESTVIVSKGTEREGMGYSPFENPAMAELVQRAGGSPVYVTGVAHEYCVRATCLDTVKHGGRAVAVLPLIRAVSAEEGVWRAVEEELAAAGVECVREVPAALRGA